MLSRRRISIGLGLMLAIAASFWGGWCLALYAHNNYSEALQRHYIDSRLMAMRLAETTIAKVEAGKTELLLSNQKTILRGEFLTLIELHKSGGYERRDEEIHEALRHAKAFMAERPKTFLDQTFVSSESLVQRINEPDAPDPASAKATQQARAQLQAAFDYVESLPK